MEPSEENNNPVNEPSASIAPEPANEPAAGAIPEPSNEPSEPIQPSGQPAKQINTDKPVKKTNISMIVTVVVTLLICIGGLIVGLLLSGLFSFGSGNNNSANDVTPTPELAESVCEKHGGEFVTKTTSSDDYASDYLCEKDEEGDNTGTLFTFEIIFLKDDTIEKYRNMMENSLVNSSMTTLEDSDEYVKTYMAPSEDYLLDDYVFAALYKNVLIDLRVANISFGEDLLAELGFPNRSRKDSLEKIEINQSESSDLNDSQSDTDIDTDDNTVE